MSVWGSWGWKWVRGGWWMERKGWRLLLQRQNISIEVAQGPIQGQSQNWELRFGHRGNSSGQSFLTRTMGHHKRNHRCRENTWPSNWSYCMLSAQKDNSQAPEQKTLNIMRSWDSIISLSSHSTASRKMAAGVSSKREVALNGSRGDLPISTCSMGMHSQSIWQVLLSVWEQ